MTFVSHRYGIEKIYVSMQTISKATVSKVTVDLQWISLRKYSELSWKAMLEEMQKKFSKSLYKKGSDVEGEKKSLVV